MNISKLLKITALSCIGMFSINNNIVNASDNGVDIIENTNSTTNNKSDTNIDNNLVFGLKRINVNDTDETKKLKDLLFHKEPFYAIKFDAEYDSKELMNKIKNFHGIILSNGNIAYYFCDYDMVKVFYSRYEQIGSYELSRLYGGKYEFNRLLLRSNTIEDLCKELGRDYKIYKSFITDNDNIIVREYKK